MTGLTLFTPVRRRWLWVLALGLPVARRLPLMRRHILQFNFIKFVRWTLVRELDGERLHSRTCSSRATSTGRGSTTSTRSRT
jgi:hypothetical protein